MRPLSYQCFPLHSRPYQAVPWFCRLGARPGPEQGSQTDPPPHAPPNTSPLFHAGKYAAIRNDGIDCLLSLINDSNSKVRLYSIKALTMLAEAPEGRKMLLFHVPEFRERLNDPSEAVQRAAQIAIEVIEWKP